MMSATTPLPAPSSYRARREMLRTNMQIKVCGYVRVSTDKQADFGLSLEAQEAEIRRYCAERGYEVARIYVDGGFSAKNTERPAYREMINDIRQYGYAAIVVTKLDRLTRSLRNLCEIREDILEPYKVNLVAIRDGINTFDPLSRQFLPFLAIIGQIERENTSERVKASIRHIHNQGGHYGKVPFGYKTVPDGRIKRLVEHPEEKPWLDKIFAWYQEGVSTRGIAERLNEAKVKPRCADKWTLHAVYELLVKYGAHKPRSVQSDFTYDKQKAYEIAYSLRTDNRTLQFIVNALTEARLRPKHAARYTVSSVQDLLRSAVFHEVSTPKGYALFLKEQGHSLREIGSRLLAKGFRPLRGGQWHAHTVKMLLLNA
jgi:DNA invertase Pin-like site-specific DNA recombinase